MELLKGGQNYIVFDNDVQYTYVPANKAIYRNNVKIAREVINCTFETGIQNGKNVVNVTYESGEQKRQVTYTLKD